MRVGFKVWDHEDKCYLRKHFFLSRHGDLFLFEGQVMRPLLGDKRYQAIMSAGVSDRAGKELYEEDIVKATINTLFWRGDLTGTIQKRRAYSAVDFPQVGVSIPVFDEKVVFLEKIGNMFEDSFLMTSEIGQ